MRGKIDPIGVIYSATGSAAGASGTVSAMSSGASDSTTGAKADTRSASRRRITITPYVERPSRFTSSTGIRITVPPVEISITW
jgi:hypothetical protein